MGRRERMEEAQQKLGRVHGPETARQKEDRLEIQGRASRTSGREKQTVKKTTKKSRERTETKPTGGLRSRRLFSGSCR